MDRRYQVSHRQSLSHPQSTLLNDFLKVYCEEGSQRTDAMPKRILKRAYVRNITSTSTLSDAMLASIPIDSVRFTLVDPPSLPRPLEHL